MSHVSVDPDLCFGSRNCVGLAPSVFASGPDDIVALTGDSPEGPQSVPDEQIDVVRRAAQNCPGAAIDLEEST